MLGINLYVIHYTLILNIFYDSLDILSDNIRVEKQVLSKPWSENNAVSQCSEMRTKY